MSSAVTLRTSDFDGFAGLTADARSLFSAKAVRDRAETMLQLGVAGALEDWTVDLSRLPAAADFVADVIRRRYPSFEVPFHARWRHFVFGGVDLAREMLDRGGFSDAAERARAAFDLVILSVLLDAGAGSDWRFVDPETGATAARSEGLALASLRWFASGGASDYPGEPLRADAERLQTLTERALGAAFQVSDENPLAGLAGRAALIRRLGRAVEGQPDLFARRDTPRPGGLFDALAARAKNGELPATSILDALLNALSPIWEGRPSLTGVDLGDCWPHPALDGPKPSSRYAPLHKLSQWLSYSLIEPLQAAGVRVVDVDGLTGLAEYRNGGLVVDLGVLTPRDPASLAKTWKVSDPFVVGWRSMTVALLDRIAPLVRERLGRTAAQMPLAAVLEGGTWAAGREIARTKRPDGGPPFKIESDGTVF
jgi:hypothetical protein